MKPQIKEQVDKLLRSAKLKRTVPRRMILEVLLRAKRPITQEEIAKKLGKNRFDKVTIYRTLESFVKAGLVHKAFLQERAQHYELADKCTESQCHPHFTCSSCGSTFCMTGLFVPMVRLVRHRSPHVRSPSMAKKTYKGFKIEHQQVSLAGLCPECK
jgi:Fur family ferric uptake transcriptional regulator